MSSALLPQLLVRGPDGQSFEIKLATERVTIGREGGAADVGLPDPQRLISRLHCVVDREGGRWWVVDHGSTNKTFLRCADAHRRGDLIETVHGRAPLADGDVIRILGRLTEDGGGAFWELVFADPTATRFAGVANMPLACLAYDWAQGRPFLVIGRTRYQLSLRPQAHLLVRHMAKKSADNGHLPVLCAHDSLIEAVWGENSYRTAADVAQLVSEVREEARRVPKAASPEGAADPSDLTDALFETERGLGYRLVTCP